jgi:protein tyrosine/serine phosphatase
MRLFFLVSVLAFTSFAADSTRLVVHVRNFGVVNEHLLRGGEPTTEGLTELGSAGVKFIVDLREPGPATDLEKQQADRLGMQYTNVPLPPLTAPSPSQIRTVLNLLAEHNSQTVFVHCRRGKDRTGTVVACYRVQHDGWDNVRALNEARSFGMSSMEHGMKAFILHFTPLPSAADPVLLTH